MNLNCDQGRTICKNKYCGWKSKKHQNPGESLEVWLCNLCYQGELDEEDDGSNDQEENYSHTLKHVGSITFDHQKRQF